MNGPCERPPALWKLQQAGGGFCVCCARLALSELALFLSALNWKQIQRITFAFLLPAFSHLCSQKCIRTDPSCQIHLQTFPE